MFWAISYIFTCRILVGFWRLPNKIELYWIYQAAFPCFNSNIFQLLYINPDDLLKHAAHVKKRHSFWWTREVAAQRRAIFWHPNFQKWSEAGVFCIVLYILTWKCASRHSGVQFFICPLATWLRARRFSEPTVGPSRPTNHWKNTAVCVTFRAPVSSFYWLFSHLSIFFLLTLLLCPAFQLSVLSTWGERSDHHYLDYSMHHSYCVPSIQSVYSHKSSDLRKEALSSYVKFRCTQTVEWISNDLKVSSSRAVKRTSSFCKYSAFFPCARCKQQSGAYWQGLVPHTPRQSFIAKFVYKQSNPHNKNGTTDFWFNLHPGKLRWT